MKERKEEGRKERREGGKKINVSLKFLFPGWMYQCICDQATGGPGHLANPPPLLDLKIIWETLVCILNFQVKTYQCFNAHPNLSVSLSWKRLHEGGQKRVPLPLPFPPSLTLVFSLPSCGFFIIIIIIIFIFMGQPTSTGGTLYWWPGSVLSMSHIQSRSISSPNL